ncbi:MAG: hypothetical protein F4Z13_06455 [Candidatus Dadabacteria bacterium]|nr:hypothetical protein [Candidatus Dadabacteria bacterium]
MVKKRNGRKRPKRKANPDPKKSPQIQTGVQESFQGHKIRWSFSILDMGGPFGWSKCSVSVLNDVLKPRLSNFETMTWAEIESHRHHSIPTGDLSTQAQKRLSDKKLSDVDEVFSLAIGSKERIIGIRDRDVFKLLWWDPKHEVCPSTKRHT